MLFMCRVLGQPSGLVGGRVGTGGRATGVVPKSFKMFFFTINVSKSLNNNLFHQKCIKIINNACLGT